MIIYYFCDLEYKNKNSNFKNIGHYRIMSNLLNKLILILLKADKIFFNTIVLVDKCVFILF